MTASPAKTAELIEMLFGLFTWVSRRNHAEALGPIYKIYYDLSYDYRKFIVRSTYDSDLKSAKICFRNIVS